MADFMNNLDRVNALAESAPGFVWRLAGDNNTPTALRPIDDRTMVNMSVWTDAQSLSAFVFRTAHVEFMRRRREWFERMAEAISSCGGCRRPHPHHGRGGDAPRAPAPAMARRRTHSISGACSRRPMRRKRRTRRPSTIRARLPSRQARSR
jgi:hypothetical protein